MECAQRSAMSQARRVNRLKSGHCCVRCGCALPADYWYVECDACKRRARELDIIRKGKLKQEKTGEGNL